jgi:WD40 repeat protein
VLAGVAALLVLAVVAGLVALEQRGTARDQATAAEAQRLGSRALAENDLDRSLLLARQGIALDDSAQTRGNLLASLIKSPAAIGVMRGIGERFSALALSPDGRTLAAGDPAGNLLLFDTRTGRRVLGPDVHPGEWGITQLAFSPNGRRLAVAHGAPDGATVTLVDPRTRRLGQGLELYDFQRAVTALRFADDDRVDVASVPVGPDAPDTIVERFAARTGERLVGPVALSQGAPSPLLASRDSRELVTTSEDAIVVRDGRTLRASRQIAIERAADHVYALAPDDRTLAVGGRDGSVRFVDLSTGAIRRASDRHGGRITDARFTPDGRSLVTVGDDGDAIVWDVGERTARETLAGHANGIAALQLTRDGATLYTAGLDGSILVWDLVGTRRLGRPFVAGRASRAHASLSPDGKRLAVGDDTGAITVVDLDDPRRRRTLPVADGPIAGIRFVPGGRSVVVLGPADQIVLVDTDSGRTVRTIAPAHESFDSVRPATPGVSADGRLLATQTSPNDLDMIEVQLWSLPAGGPLGAPLRLDRSMTDAQLSPDGRLLAVALANSDQETGAVETWDVRERRRIRTIDLRRVPAFVRFSPDGRRFAIGNRRGESRVYETATSKPATRVLAGDAGGIIDASIAPDGRTLATGSETGAVQLWDLRSGQPLGAPLPGVPSSAVVPAFTPDGDRLVATYATGQAYMWDIRPGSLAKHACVVAGRRLTRAEWAEFLPGRAYDPAC